MQKYVHGKKHTFVERQDEKASWERRFRRSRPHQTTDRAAQISKNNVAIKTERRRGCNVDFPPTSKLRKMDTPDRKKGGSTVSAESVDGKME